MKHPPSIFDYLDYRLYLSARMDWEATQQQRFSFREFSRRAKLGAPNFVQQVIEGKRNPAAKHLDDICLALSLDAREATYLRLLVSYDQARSFEEKERLYSSILKERISQGARELEESQYRYLSDGIHAAVRELLGRTGIDGDPGRIAKALDPPVGVGRVKKSLKLLEELGLARRDGKGRLVAVAKVLKTPAQVGALAAGAYHRHMLALAQRSLTAHPPERRDIRGVTLGLSAKGYGRLQARLEEFWHEVMLLAREESGSDEVYQFNQQLFPLARHPREKPGRPPKKRN